MSELTTQGIVEKINSTTVQSIQLKGKIAEVKQRLAEYPENQELEELNKQLTEVTAEDTELRTLAKNKMIDAGMKKFEALDGTTIQLNKKPWALVIEDESIEALNDYKKEKVTVSIDKKQLKEDIKEWIIIDGVSIKEDYTLVIKN